MTAILPRTLVALGLSLLLAAAQAEQTCNEAVRSTAPDSRFQDNGNGTDLATGLIWKQCPEGQSGAGCAAGNAQLGITLVNADLLRDALRDAATHSDAVIAKGDRRGRVRGYARAHLCLAASAGQ